MKMMILFIFLVLKVKCLWISLEETLLADFLNWIFCFEIMTIEKGSTPIRENIFYGSMTLWVFSD
jgi:hypothetical protein